MMSTVMPLQTQQSGSRKHVVTMVEPEDAKDPGSSTQIQSGGRHSSRSIDSVHESFIPKAAEKSDAIKWQKLHESHMMERLKVKHDKRKAMNQVTREDARHLARKIPMEILAKDWLGDSDASIETRAFLVERVLPTLILGCEKLLIEVNRRDLSLVRELSSAFNPINFLAQYLMRNNPRYSNFSEASPYIRGLRQVSEELKKQLFDFEDNRLARIKAGAQRRREDRENEETRRVVETQRRADLLRRQFNEWNVSYVPNGRVQFSVLQNALRLFSEITELLPESLRGQAAFSQDIGPTDDTGKVLSQKEFVSMVQLYVEGMPPEVFNQFLDHLNRCATVFRAQNNREQRRTILSQLFISCDNAGVGLLDRHRILNLFEMFYDKAKDSIQETLRNPRAWPLVDTQVAESDSGDDEEDDKTKLQEATSSHADADVVVDDDEVSSEEPSASVEQAVEPNLNVLSEDNLQVIADEEDGEEDAENVDMAATMVAEETTIDASVSEQEKAASPVQEKENDETESAAPPGERLGTADDEREPELTRLVDQDGNPSQLTDDTGNSADPDRPTLTQQSKVSFAEGTTFQKERTSIVLSQGSRSQSQASAYDENTLNVSQFVHTIETFLGDIPNTEAFHQLVRYIKTGYMETEEERMQRLYKARQEAQQAKRKSLLNSLFEMWDNDGSGIIHLDEVQGIMKKYKEGQESDPISNAKKEFKKKSRIQDSRINKREFRDFVHLVVSKMAGEDAFDYFVDFMLNSVERSYAERVRGEARKKWLQQIVNTAYTSGASLEPVYKAVFQALYKDADTHGHNKVISANIAMLERNDIVPHRGDFMLRYVSATPDDAPYVLGRALFRDMKGISFASVDSGKPIHVPRVNNHGNIHFWNPEREVEDINGRPKDGSFIVIPLKDRKKRVFGLLGIDTLNDPHSRSLFITHEIQFFQGITRSFSIAYHHVDVRHKTMRISESAVSWIHRRSPHVHEITVYMVEPDDKGHDYVLRKMMTTNHKGTTGLKKNPPRLERRDNLFRDYLFKCVDNSEAVNADAYGERHLAIPLRDDEGLAIVCIDISIGDLVELPKNENREVMKMLRLLQTAYKEIAHESKEGQRTVLLEGDRLDEDSRTEILFDRLMLLELRENVSKLSPTAYAELKSYAVPPRVVHMIVKAVVSIFFPKEARDGYFNKWSHCKQFLNPQLSEQIKVYDPTSDVSTDNVPIDMIHKDLEEVPHGQVFKHGSIPAQYLYNWVFVCVSLMEHSRKMRNTSRADLLTEIVPPSKKREASNVNASQHQQGSDQALVSLVESKDTPP